MKFPVFYGSVRTERKGIRAAKYMVAQIESMGHEAILIDPLEYDFGLLKKKYKEYGKGEAPAKMAALSEIIKSSDGYILVSGEYNHSIPPALSNLVDHFFEEYFFKPSGIVTYSIGAYAGVRAGIQLRALLGEIGSPSISSMLAFDKVHENFGEEGELLKDTFTKPTKRFLSEFEWYARSAKESREKYGVPY